MPHRPDGNRVPRLLFRCGGLRLRVEPQAGHERADGRLPGSLGQGSAVCQSVIWVAVGYTIAFGGDGGGLIGDFSDLGLAGLAKHHDVLGDGTGDVQEKADPVVVVGDN